MLLKVKHIAVIGLAYFVFDFSIFMIVVYFMLYYLFCKGFMIFTYCPVYIETVGLAQEYQSKVLDEAITPNSKDNRFKFYLKENSQFTLSRLNYLYNMNKPEYFKQINGAGSFAFLIMPILVTVYFRLKRLNKYLKQRLDQNS